MQTLTPIRPRFARLWSLNPSSLSIRTLSPRAFSSSSSSSSDYSNQSRGGLPRFFSELLPTSKGGIVRVQGDEFWHMTKVLRLRTNDRVELFNGKGGLIQGLIQSVDRSGLDFVALEDPKSVLPQSTQWHVFAAFGTLKGGRADWLVEKCTELGASSLTPLLTERSPTVSENRLDRLQRVNMAAAKQCQRLHEMILNPPKNINGLLPLVAESKLAFLAVAEGTPLVSALTSSGTESSGLIVVGPEGGLPGSSVEAHVFDHERFSIIPRVKRKRFFLKNGSILLEDLIASCDGKSHPICCYSAAEIIRATNNFDPSCVIDRLPDDMYRGILDDRTVIIKKHYRVSEAIRDIIISMQMSTHKNSLKLLGCCLEFDRPALVLENAGKGGLNSDGSLVVDDELLPWKTRLRIAKQLASALTYLHTAFPRPIVHRNLESTHILLDDDYVPKLFDFSFSITIPPDQLYVVDVVQGTLGYLDPAYMMSECITEKTDVFSFGVLLLVFLTGQRAILPREGGDNQYVVQYARSHAFEDQFRTIVDPKILEDVGEGEQAQQQLHDFLTMALLCTEEESELRPDMIDVAKKLVEIEKSMFPS